MRKRIWGKDVLALLLSAALVTGSLTPINAKAESLGEENTILAEESADIELDQEAISDGNAEGTEATNVKTEEVSDDNSEAGEGDLKPEGDQAAPETLEENTGDEEKEPEATEDEADAVDAVSGGNAESVTEVSGGNPEASQSGAFDCEKHIGEYIIKLHAEPGIVPDGTEVEITEVDKVAGQEVDDLVNDVLPAESAVVDSASFDIKLIKDGVEFEPNGTVSVEITLDDTLSEENSENDSTSVQVFHIEDDATTTEVEAEVVDNATDVHTDSDETVVSYDAESFSVYDVSVVLNFETSVAKAEVNPVYANRIDVEQSELDSLASCLDSTVNVKSLLYTSDGRCSSVQEMAEVARAAIAMRQPIVTINFKLPRFYNSTQLYNAMLPIIWEHTGVPTEGDYTRWAFIDLGDQITLAHYGDMSYGTVQLSFTYTHSAAQEVQTTNKINEIIKSKKLNQGSDYDKIRKTYEYITSTIVYDHDCANNYKYRKNPIGYSCYSAACLNKTVCEGYSLLFYRIMLTVGVDARLIAGLAEKKDSTSGHGWNIVQLGNKYYYLDATWDAKEPGNKGATKYWFLKATGKDSRKFIIGTKTFECDFDVDQHVRYDEYATADIMRVYPVSTTNYDASKAVSYVKPTGVAISQTSATIGVGSGFLLTASCLPANAAQGIVWNSSDSTVATVANGYVTGIKNGECEIFATSIYSGKKARCRVLVTDGVIKELTVPSKISVFAGSKVAINPVIFPEWVGTGSLKFKSSNKKIATVNKKGIVTGKKAGKCRITITTKNGGIYKSITVRVKKAKRVKSIKLSKKKLNLSIGSTYTLKVKFKPKKATNKNVTWKSSKPGVVSVDAYGNIVALSKGKAKITAKSQDGKHKATCTVKVR